MRVEVAAVQLNREPMFEGPSEVMETLDRRLHWADRPTVSVHAESPAKLTELLDAGGSELGLRAREGLDWEPAPKPSDPAASLGFYFDGGGELAPFDIKLNDVGSAQWWFDRSSATLDNVIAAKEARLFFGDPFKLYIVVDEPPEGRGNGLDIWFEILRALPQIQTWVKSAADTVEPWATLVNVVAAASVVIRKARDRWYDNGGDLERFGSLFVIGRTTGQAAALLNTREEYVPPLLQFLGLEQGQDGYWRVSNKPERKQLAELASVANTAGHMHLGVSALRKGLAEVLALPAGQRAKHAEGIFRRHQFETYEQQSDEDPYIARAENGRDDQFEVIDFDSGEHLVKGTIQAEDDGTYSVLDPSGRSVVDKDGATRKFSDIDGAAAFIAAGYTGP